MFRRVRERGRWVRSCGWPPHALSFGASCLWEHSWCARGRAGATPVAATAVLATAYDALTDHRGVADGHWTYTDDLPGPRFRGVPWWNFVGWLAISGTTAAFAVPFL